MKKSSCDKEFPFLKDGIERDRDEYEWRVARKTTGDLLYTALDSARAVIALPEGVNTRYYAQEIESILSEILERRDRGVS